MRKFFAKVARFRAASKVVFHSVWAWVSLLVISPTLLAFGLGAMSEGKYILALAFYFVAVGVVALKAIYDWRAHELKKEIAIIVITFSSVVLLGLSGWTAWKWRFDVAAARAASANADRKLADRKLKEQANIIVSKIRAMNIVFDTRMTVIRDRSDRKEINNEEFGRLWEEELQRAGEEFERDLKTDALIVLWELRKRVPAETRKHIIGLKGIPDIVLTPDGRPDVEHQAPVDGPNGAPVSSMGVMGIKFDFAFSRTLADEIEQLTKLLPDD
jgi:hypothetical protein